MRKRLSIVFGSMLACLSANCLVSAAVDLSRALPFWSYKGLGLHVLLVVEWLWSKAHGWPSFSHLDDFGRWYAYAVRIGCPLLGFLVFWLISRCQIGWDLWKPLLIASVCGPLSTLTCDLFSRDISRFVGRVTNADSYPAIWEPWWEMLAAVLVFALMVWSVGAFAAAPEKLCAPGHEQAAVA